MTRLSDVQIAEALKGIEGWERFGDEIVRTVRFPSFTEGIAFIHRVADLAEAVDHHPDIDIRYRNIRFALSTHDEGGLTEKDVALARQINQALAEAGLASG